ncbi:hypothetical protein [Mycoplana dimorpha]|nr:hypothetical protein [Mycoplana dimorpha]
MNRKRQGLASGAIFCEKAGMSPHHASHPTRAVWRDPVRSIG